MGRVDSAGLLVAGSHMFDSPEKKVTLVKHFIINKSNVLNKACKCFDLSKYRQFYVAYFIHYWTG